jgi:chemotaxis protein histidine kinase CheA
MRWNGRTSDEATRGPSCCYVVVTIGGRLFAFDAKSFKGDVIVDEVPDEVVSIDGAVYPPVALADCLEVSQSLDSVNQHVILLAHQNRRGCIGVDRVHGQVAYQASEIVPLPLHFQGAEREWYQGMILFQNSVAVILNISWVLNAPQSDSGTRPLACSEDFSCGSGAYLSEVMAKAKVQKC